MPAEERMSGEEHARIARRRKQLGVPAREVDPDGNWALALSGGGIRSATFCLGVLQALAKAPPPPLARARTDHVEPGVGASGEASGKQANIADASAGGRADDGADDRAADSLPPRAAAAEAAASGEAIRAAGEPAVPEPEPVPPPSIAPAAPAAATLLGQFDYVSSVSGGGYIAAFFCSLFLPGRLRRGSNPPQAGQEAYRTLAFEPPGRIHASASYAAEPGRAAMAWLRENGRYLMPSGAGDGFYAASLMLRNWLALHYVIGSALLLLLTVFALGQHLLLGTVLALGRHELDLLHDARQSIHEGGWGLWWSTWLWLPLVALVVAVPPGIAYFLVYLQSQDPLGLARSNSVATRFALALGIVLLGVGIALGACATGPVAANLFLAMGVLTLFAVACCIAMTVGASITVSAYRVRATRVLSVLFSIALWLGAIAVADTVARTVYLHFTMAGSAWGPVAPTALLGALVWLTRAGAGLLDGKSSQSGVAGLLARLPATLLAGAVAAVVALLLYVLWSWVVLWVRWNGREPVDWLVLGTACTVPALAALACVALLLTVVAARFAGFLNVSTLQSFYGARLTRAYLGASNGERFHAVDATGRPRGRASFSVAEPVDGDQLNLNSYYDPRVLAPVHLINVTLNLTVDPAEQLVQRDRKGKPLCLAPGPFVLPPTQATPSDAYVRFTVDGEVFYPETHKAADSELTQSRSVGDWVAISGAAISTGLGRASTLGTSMLLGLANLRLGTWWPSYPLDACSRPRKGGASPDRVQADPATRPWLGAFISLFRTQYYLTCELTARFHGTHRGWQYLSDGGHFENTAVYELLRPERNVSLIVLCDCGCDPDYRFGDLANLIRLARIDHGLEIAVDTEAARDAVLGTVFGQPADFARRAAGADRQAAPRPDQCAVLLDVFRAEEPAATRVPVCRIVLLKPALFACAPADVCQYGTAHPAFPQESTSDQFFDEAQWESYRELGFAIGQRVFGGGSPGAGGDAVACALHAH